MDQDSGPGRLGRATAPVAWALCAVCAALATLGLVFGAWNYAAPATYGHEVVPGALLALSFPFVGALIATHRPRNPLGWVFCTVGLSQSLVTFAGEYGTYALAGAPGSLPGGDLALWASGWAWAPGAGCLITFDGRLPSRRWRPVAWASALPIVLIPAIVATASWSRRGPALLTEDDQALFGTAVATVVSWAFWLMLVCGLACVAAPLIRFRRSRGIERQQLKWFVSATVVTVAVFSVTSMGGTTQQDLVLLLALPLVPSIPVAAGIAILRYRLYEIDRLINRTLSYGLLTTILGLGYAGTVLALGQLFGGVTEDPPSWAVAGATLAVAALFQPLRHRVQAAVDRRFNRRRYDAARTIEAFSTRLRDQVDLDTLSSELLEVVDRTMEPSQVSLWLQARP
jgi:hypothetical protein